jgi:hypothetical protein
MRAFLWVCSEWGQSLLPRSNHASRRIYDSLLPRVISAPEGFSLGLPLQGPHPFGHCERVCWAG